MSGFSPSGVSPCVDHVPPSTPMGAALELHTSQGAELTGPPGRSPGWSKDSVWTGWSAADSPLRPVAVYDVVLTVVGASSV